MVGEQRRFSVVGVSAVVGLKSISERGNGMVYEIYFEPRGAVWRIRITTFILAFIPVSRVVMKPDEQKPLLKPMDFATYEDAEKYARRVGLGSAYQRRERHHGYTTQVSGVSAHGIAYPQS